MKQDRSHQMITSKIFWVVILLIIILSRFLWLDRYPAGIQQDEAFAGWFAYSLGNFGIDNFGYGNPVYFTAWGSGMSVLYSYLSIPFVKILGLNAWAVRLPQVIFASLSILAFYGIVKRTVSHRLAMILTFFMAINPWHIVMCRWGLDASLVPAFFLFSTYFFVRGLEKKPWLLLSAFFYGLTLYCYATFWLVLPFVLLFQLLYAIRCKKLSFDRYLVGFILILGALAIPLFLFLAVNYGFLPEIKTSLISIPKMAYYRGGEFSFSQIPANITEFFKMFFTQEDRYIWNAVPGYGYYYLFSWPFILIGFLVIAKRSLAAWKEKTLYFPAVFLVMFLIFVLESMLLADGELNKINNIHLTVILFCAVGFYECQKRVGDKIALGILLLYLVTFGMFWHEYTTDYQELISQKFQEGSVEALAFASELTDDTIIVHYNIYYPKILYATRMDPYTAANTTVYKNYPAKFLEVKTMANFERHLHLEDYLDSCSVFVWPNEEGEKELLLDAGFQIKEFANYLVAYK